MASSPEKGGKPGVEKKPEWSPKKQVNDSTVRGLGRTAIKGASGKK